MTTVSHTPFTPSQKFKLEALVNTRQTPTLYTNGTFVGFKLGAPPSPQLYVKWFANDPVSSSQIRIRKLWGENSFLDVVFYIKEKTTIAHTPFIYSQKSKLEASFSTRQTLVPYTKGTFLGFKLETPPSPKLYVKRFENHTNSSLQITIRAYLSLNNVDLKRMLNECMARVYTIKCVYKNNGFEFEAHQRLLS